MFLHAREQDNPSNIRYMGLTVNKYIPDVKQAQSESWEGAIGIIRDEAKRLSTCFSHILSGANNPSKHDAVRRGMFNVL